MITFDKFNLLNWTDDNWYFRGQPNADWELIPSVWRETFKPKFEKFKSNFSEDNLNRVKQRIANEKKAHNSNIKDERLYDLFLFIYFERFLLANFYHRANKSGLLAPDEVIKLTNHYFAEYNFFKRGITPPFVPPLSKFADYLDNQKDTQDLYDYVRFEKFDPNLPQHYGLPTRSLRNM